MEDTKYYLKLGEWTIELTEPTYRELKEKGEEVFDVEVIKGYFWNSYELKVKE